MGALGAQTSEAFFLGQQARLALLGQTAAALKLLEDLD